MQVSLAVVVVAMINFHTDATTACHCPVLRCVRLLLLLLELQATKQVVGYLSGTDISPPSLASLASRVTAAAAASSSLVDVSSVVLSMPPIIAM